MSKKGKYKAPTTSLDDLDINWGPGPDYGWPEDEVTKEYPLPNFELLNPAASGVHEVVADDFNVTAYTWETKELKDCYYYDIARIRGANRGAFYVEGSVIVGYQILDDSGWKKLEGRRA